jgi:hypothetical protein
MTVATLIPILALGALQSPVQASAQEPVVIDEMLFIINDNIITRADVMRASRRLSNGSPPSPNEQNQALQNLLTNTLYMEGFLLNGGFSEMLDGAVDDAIQQMVDQAGSLAELNLRLNNQGRTIADEEKRIRRQYANIFFLQAEFGFVPVDGTHFKAKINVSPSQLRAYFEEHREDFKHDNRVRARVIILLNEQRTDKRELIQELHEIISSGELSFVEAAKKHSQYKPTLGGSTGSIKPDDRSFQKPIRDFLASAISGQMSTPLELTNNLGWALVLAEDVQKAGFTPFADAQMEIARILSRGQQSDLQQQALNRIAEHCYVWAAPGLGPILDSLLGRAIEEEL